MGPLTGAGHNTASVVTNGCRQRLSLSVGTYDALDLHLRQFHGLPERWEVVEVDAEDGGDVDGDKVLRAGVLVRHSAIIAQPGEAV